MDGRQGPAAPSPRASASIDRATTLALPTSNSMPPPRSRHRTSSSSSSNS